MIDELGSVLLQESIALPAPRRALVTILEEEPTASDTPLLSQGRYPLRGTPLRYQNPLEPVAEQEWEVFQVPAAPRNPVRMRVQKINSAPFVFVADIAE